MDAAACALLADPRLKLTTAVVIKPQWQAVAACGFPLLEQGQVHEWALAADGPRGAVWYPPLTLLAALAGQCAGEGRRIVWIGRGCWPSFQLLCAALAGVGEWPMGALLERSVFLDPLTDAERFWGIGQALRCAAVKVVVADGSGMTQTVSRRLQLAAEAGAGVLGLLARPPWELELPSWAATRWRVKPQIETLARAMAWEIELTGCRGRHPGPEVPRHWTMERSYQVYRGTSALHLSPRVGCGTVATPGANQLRPQSRTA